jgi:hypothetical protein
VSSNDAQACLVWKAPASGKVKISGRARKWKNEGDGVIIEASINNGNPFMARAISSNDMIQLPEYTKSIEKGDEIWYALNPKASVGGDFTQIVPIIEYIEVK